MKQMMILVILTFVAISLSAGLAWDWAVQTNCSSIAVNGMVIDKKDNVYLVAKFWDDFQIGEQAISPVGGEDILILKYDNTGKLLWALPAGGEDTDNGLAIAISPSGGIYAAGNFVSEASFGSFTVSSEDTYNHDIFVAKVSEAGKWEWVKSYGSMNEETVFSLAVDSKKSIYLAGNFSSNISFGESELTTDYEVPAFFLARMKSNGEPDWAVPIRLVSDGYINKLVLNNKEQPAIAGNFDTEMDVDNEIILMSNGGWDGFVIQFDQTGYALWAKYFGDDETDSVNDMVSDKQGNLYITGNFSGIMDMGKDITADGLTDIFIAKIAPGGNWVWANSCGGESAQYSVAISLGANGKVVAGGNFAESMSIGDKHTVNDADDGLFVAEADADGNWLGLYGATGSDMESVRNLVCDSKGNIIAVGDFVIDLQIGNASLETSSEAYYDKSLFLSRMKNTK